MFYREIQPCAALQPYIKCFWILQADALQHFRDYVFPDGCLELLFHLGQRMRRQHELQQFSNLIGQIDQALELNMDGDLHVIAARFYPWGAAAFFPFPLHEIQGTQISAAEAWGNEATVLEQRMLNQKGHEVESLEAFLLQKLNPGYDINFARNAVLTFRQQQGNISVETVADAMNTGLRHFNRRFNQAVGISPKAFARILRFQHFFRQAELHPGAALSELAQRCGYYDQAHFIREFKHYTTFSPAQFLKQEQALGRFFLD